MYTASSSGTDVRSCRLLQHTPRGAGEACEREWDPDPDALGGAADGDARPAPGAGTNALKLAAPMMSPEEPDEREKSPPL
jgi:hypothetical protein